MKIGEIFKKDIHRSISGVVKVQDVEDSLVWQELDEYVVTPEIAQRLSKFLNAYNDTITTPGDDIGVWVSGFFGSGKSHFIKMLNYLLANQEVKDPSTGSTHRPAEVFKAKDLDGLLLADLHKANTPQTKTVLFNIDSKESQKDGEHAILNVFLREFNALQGFYGKRPFVAQTERRLRKEGVYEQFEQEFEKATGKKWIDNRDQVLLLGKKVVEALSAVLPESSSEDVAAWFEDLKKNYSPSIDEFAEMLSDYVENIEPGSRIVFLVDEVGQFVGENTEKMLKLQTLAEDIGTHCKGKVWIIVTSQEDIDKVIGDIKQSTANDFSKIQGRFKTRLSLSSVNVDEVIKKRLLEKNESAAKELSTIFKEKEPVLKNLLSFSTEGKAMSFYEDSDDFVATYPFVPYQFEILQNVFTTIRQIGATGQHLSSGERSMIDGFQSASKALDGKELGTLVPFYSFYDCVENNLDSAITRTIGRAAADKALNQPFDVDLLKLLFLIRHQEKEIPPTIDNLATLSVRHVDEDKLQLKKDIEAGLERLEKQSLIRRQDDKFYFLTDEEQEVQREIQHMEFDSSKAARTLGEMVYDEIFRVSNKSKYERLNQVFSLTRICDGHNLDRPSELEFSVVSPFHDVYPELVQNAAMRSSTTTERGIVLIPLNENSRFDREFRAFMNTEAFTERPQGTQSDARRRIIEDLRQQNRERRKLILTLLENLLIESPVYIGGKQWKGSIVKKPSDLFKQAFNYLVENTYSKLALIGKACKDPDAEIASIMREPDITKLFANGIPHEQASNDLKNYVQRQTDNVGGVALNDLIERYNRIPFGWPERETALIVARLVLQAEITLHAQGEVLGKKDAIPYLTNSQQWKLVKVKSRAKISDAILSQAQRLAKEWFGATPTVIDEDGLASFIKEKLGEKHEELGKSLVLVQTNKYPGENTLEAGVALVERLQAVKDPGALLSAFSEAEQEVKTYLDDYQDVGGFLKSQTTSWNLLVDVASRIERNRQYLDAVDGAGEIAVQVSSILSNPNPYGLLKDAKSLSDKFQVLEKSLFEDYRTKASTALSSAIERLKEACAKLEINEEAKVEGLLAPLNDGLVRLGSLNSISDIHNLELTAESLLQRQALRAREIAEAAKTPKPNEPKQPAKTITPQYVTASKRVPLSEGLTTEEQVDKFINELRVEILEAIKKGPVFLK